MDMVDPSSPPPPWLTSEDVASYTSLYKNSGLESPLQVPYRLEMTKFFFLQANLNPGLHLLHVLLCRSKLGEFTIKDPKIEVPMLLIMGGKDYFLKFPGIEEYINRGEVGKYVNDLEMKFIADGSHFIQEQFPEQVNEQILNFLKSSSH